MENQLLSLVQILQILCWGMAVRQWLSETRSPEQGFPTKLPLLCLSLFLLVLLRLVWLCGGFVGALWGFCGVFVSPVAHQAGYNSPTLLCRDIPRTNSLHQMGSSLTPNSTYQIQPILAPLQGYPREVQGTGKTTLSLDKQGKRGEKSRIQSQGRSSRAGKAGSDAGGGLAGRVLVAMGMAGKGGCSEAGGSQGEEDRLSSSPWLQHRS